jgi:hypothetical protein
MPVSRRRERRRSRREKRRHGLMLRAEASGRLATDTRKDTRTGLPYVVGVFDGRVVYASKPLASGESIAHRRKRWLRRAARRLL